MCELRVCVKNPCDVGTTMYGDAPLADQACCMSAATAHPATCGDKHGGIQPTNVFPVTDQDCGEGYVYNPAQAHRQVYEWSHRA